MKLKLGLGLILLVASIGFLISRRLPSITKQRSAIAPITIQQVGETLSHDERSGLEPDSGAEGEFTSVASESKLPIFLVGTIVRADPNASQATLRLTKSGTANEYQTNGMIGDHLKIRLIQRERIYLVNLETQKIEYIQFGPFDITFSPNAEKIEKARDNQEFQLQRSAVEDALKDLPKLLSEARAVPLLAPDGSVRGFQIFDIAKGSVFEKLGLISGDSIDEVEGQPIKSAADAIQLFNQLRSSSMIRLSIDRNGVRHKLIYLIR